MEGVKENTTLERDAEYWFDLGRELLPLRDVDDDESTWTEPFLFLSLHIFVSCLTK